MNEDKDLRELKTVRAALASWKKKPTTSDLEKANREIAKHACREKIMELCSRINQRREGL